ncbi:pectinesterase family protein [Opitutus terrae]|uniref:pectinesterase family protein n=1 Tax=Opitutus terrae TaxID=107709 RepID=UPI00192C7487|nr:pectinesterase family protein [Opitutus terrae]
MLASVFTAVGSAKPDAIVAPDGSGQFTSLQDAISAAPMRTDPAAPAWVILVKPGTYRERIYVQRERGNIHVLGEDATTTIVSYDLHANLPGPDGKPIGTFRTPTLQIDGDGMIWENITIANSAGPVGQALALRADGDRLVFRHCRFLGWQDTLLLNRGRHYFVDCTIEGHVDFIFGAATAFFDHCAIRCLRDGYITAASTPKGAAHGFVFADCTITGAEGVKTYLGRPWRDFAQTVFLRTEMSAAVRPEGWHNWNKPHAEQTTFYAEFGSTGPGANPSARVAWAHTLTAEDAADLTPAHVLGGADGWDPVAGAERASVSRESPTTSATTTDAAPPPRRPGITRIVLVGDSTVTDRSGWGRGFKQLLGPGAECINTALGGRSSKSFRGEGHWEPALALRGDYYLIQFGHNDQPGKGPKRETDPDTTFAQNLARYVDEVRAIGAEPVLLTSLTRRNFDPANPGRILSTLTPYANAAKRVAREKAVPLIDLHARSIALCEAWGPERTAALNPRKPNSQDPDTTHLDANGSTIFAQLVVDDLRQAVPALAFILQTAPQPGNRP